MGKTSGNSGGLTLLEEPRTEYYRPAADQKARTARPARAAAEADPEDGEPFLRSRRRVPVRRGFLPPWAKTRWGKIVLAAGIVTALAAGVTVVIVTREFLDHDPRFRIDSSSAIQTVGNSQLSREDLLSVFGSDIGRNIFYVPLDERRADLERFAWVKRATVMRVLPNQLRVEVAERKPVAFVEVGRKIELADADGVILDMSPQEIASRHYSFPVVLGIDPRDPLSVRGARMQIFQRFLRELDSGGEKVSSQLSEVNLSDPADVRATVTGNGSGLELQFGQEDFLARWHNYQAHIAEWRAQYPHLADVDLRYEHEVVLKMAPDAPAPPSASAASGPVASSAKKPVAARAKTAERTRGAHATKHPMRGAR